MHTIIPAKDMDLCFSGGQGVIKISYADLVEKLGTPQDEDGCSKTQVNWYMKLITKDGKEFFFSVYDWKQRKPIEKVTEFNVGGFDDDLLLHLSEYLEVKIDSNGY